MTLELQLKSCNQLYSQVCELLYRRPPIGVVPSNSKFRRILATPRHRVFVVGSCPLAHSLSEGLALPGTPFLTLSLIQKRRIHVRDRVFRIQYNAKASYRRQSVQGIPSHLQLPYKISVLPKRNQALLAWVANPRLTFTCLQELSVSPRYTNGAYRLVFSLPIMTTWVKIFFELIFCLVLSELLFAQWFPFLEEPLWVKQLLYSDVPPCSWSRNKYLIKEHELGPLLC